MSTIKKEIVDELMAPARIRFKRRKTVLKGIHDLWQIDLLHFKQYARFNNNITFILTVIDCFSKYAWAVPVKTKNANDVTNAMNKIFQQSGRVPKNIQSDRGLEFYNSKFQELMKKYNINHYSTYSSIKASIVERFNRTLLGRIYKHFHYNGTYKYLNTLPKIVDEYNNTIHSTIKMKPSEVNKRNEKNILLKQKRAAAAEGGKL